MNTDVDKYKTRYELACILIIVLFIALGFSSCEKSQLKSDLRSLEDNLELLDYQVLNEFDQGREIGYDDGYRDGYDEGYDDGEDAGRESGYEFGFMDGAEAGYSDGYADCEAGY